MGRTFRGDNRRKMIDRYNLEREKRNKKRIKEDEVDKNKNKRYIEDSDNGNNWV
jgi:hypothetical protein